MSPENYQAIIPLIPSLNAYKATCERDTIVPIYTKAPVFIPNGYLSITTS